VTLPPLQGLVGIWERFTQGGTRRGTFALGYFPLPRWGAFQTTLTKRTAEELTDYLRDIGINLLRARSWATGRTCGRSRVAWR
jgi:hypothetical protein